MTMARVIPLDLAMNLHKAAVDAGKTNIKMQVWHCMWTIVCLCYSARRDMLDPKTLLDPIFFPIPFFMTKKAWIHKRVPGGRKVQIISQICAGPCLQWHFLHFEQCGRVSNHTIHWLFINFRCLQQIEDWVMERYTVPKNYQQYWMTSFSVINKVVIFWVSIPHFHFWACAKLIVVRTYRRGSVDHPHLGSLLTHVRNIWWKGRHCIFGTNSADTCNMHGTFIVNTCMSCH